MFVDDMRYIKNCIKNIENQLEIIVNTIKSLGINEKNIEKNNNLIYTKVKSCRRVTYIKRSDFMGNVENKDIKAPYDALDLAKYIINKYNTEFKEGISNLKLQKVLYYIQESYVLEDKGKAFDNIILAWQYGPVVKDVYYKYRKFGYGAIKENEDINSDILSSIESDNIINIVIDKTKSLTPIELVEETHSQNTPWTLVYVQKGNMYESITEEDILNARINGYSSQYC